MGDACPTPVIKTKKAMQALTGPEVIEVLVDNEIAVQNVSKMAAASGGEVTSEQTGEKAYKVVISVKGGVTTAEAEEEACACAPAGNNSVVVIASDRMREGN